MTFKIYTFNNAPGESKENLRKVESDKGFIPNIIGVFAGAPAVLDGFLKLKMAMDQTSLSPTEREIVFLTVSRKNGSPYCTAVHNLEATANGVDAEIIHALQSGEPLPDFKLESLRQYTLGIMDNHGRPSDDAINTFLAAGYKAPQALEILLAISLKTLTNYANRLAHPPIDEAFRQFPDHLADKPTGKEHIFS